VFRRAWETTTDPRARLVTEYVFDQLAGDGFWVHAVETLRPQDPALYPVLAFRAFHHEPERALPAAVVIETSEQAKSAGTPFVIAVIAGSVYRVIRAVAVLPPYAELRPEVLRLLGDALRAPPDR
jgi:hypothetical protein